MRSFFSFSLSLYRGSVRVFLGEYVKPLPFKVAFVFVIWLNNILYLVKKKCYLEKACWCVSFSTFCIPRSRIITAVWEQHTHNMHACKRILDKCKSRYLHAMAKTHAVFETIDNPQWIASQVLSSTALFRFLEVYSLACEQLKYKQFGCTKVTDWHLQTIQNNVIYAK